MEKSDIALSKTEREILRLISLDYSNKEIAKELYLSISTIKWYIRIIYSKINVRGRVQAGIVAYKNGYLE